MLVLAIETSCDETAAAILDDEELHSSIVYSQLDVHRPYGGVVPELASRAHLETLVPTIEEALQQANVDKSQVEAIAVTHGPGLIGALLVGVNAAKAMGLALDVPFLGVNHLEGHIFASQLDHPAIQPPLITLLVSGGHTILILVNDWGDYEILGQTLDDAAGEAFDKVAKMLELGYPGGPIIDQTAKQGDPQFHRFPRSWLEPGSYDFSFSGLKTSVLNYIESKPADFIKEHLADIAASFQDAVADVLIGKTLLAIENSGIRKMALTGGVARNSYLRSRFHKRAEEENLQLYFPSPDFCTDNAAMVGKAGLFYLTRGDRSDYTLDAIPNLKLVNRPA
jgi:N6-L-threonylcarbamoyladenine synthase